MGPLKLSIIALMGLSLAACQQEAGFIADFPPVGGASPMLLPETGMPTDLTPQSTSDEEMIESLNSAVDNALAENGTTLPPVSPVTPILEPVSVDPVTGEAIASDSGVLNLALQSQDEQRIAREADAAALAAAAANRVIIQPGQMPAVIADVNIITYARETSNNVGERQFRRPTIRRLNSGSQCAKFNTADNAQRNFLANGGPQDDPLNLDPDGDGFACRWSPEAYRALVLN